MANFKYKKVHIEITNVCNLKCSFCPAVERTNQFMSPKLFEEVLIKVKDQAQWICLHLMGEPTAHPQFAEIVNICRDHQKKIYLVTNGLLLEKHLSLFQGQLAFHQVNISMQSYWDNFPHKDITPYVQKVLSFGQHLSQHETQTYLNYRFWDGGQTSDKSSQAIQMILQNYGLSGLDVNELRRGMNHQRKRQHLTERHIIHFDQRFLWPSRQNPNYGHQGFCQALRTHLGVLVDGTVVPCCLDSEGNLALGNLTNHSLKEISQGERAQKLKQGFAAGERRESFCQHCDFINRFQKQSPDLKASGTTL
jgi:radical SAM protein with 4Fe4S-binding SPASM domain